MPSDTLRVTQRAGRVGSTEGTQAMLTPVQEREVTGSSQLFQHAQTLSKSFPFCSKFSPKPRQQRESPKDVLMLYKKQMIWEVFQVQLIICLQNKN